ncbi:MAG: hypothetical protein EOP48_19785 [Sphingobacteriales bacterium]|nr:MAG: hypothetical protein EOP48_19785 [Sphingobacteriales bacterium]
MNNRTGMKQQEQECLGFEKLFHVSGNLMRKVVLFTILFLVCGLVSDAQSVLKGKSSKVAVSIKLVDTLVTTVDSVRFVMTLTNTSGATQKLLFDKPMKSYPWSTNVSLNRKPGQPIKVTTWAFLSSQLYMEQQLKEFYRELKPGESISHTYYLGNVVRFDTKDGSLSKGTYTLGVNYEAIRSNEVTFAVQ